MPAAFTKSIRCNDRCLAKEIMQMTSMKKLSIMCVAAAWALVIAGEAMGQWEAQWEKAVAAAKKEGELSIYLNAPAPVRPALTKAFDEKFGIRGYRYRSGIIGKDSV
jgi:hypothetical protein